MADQKNTEFVDALREWVEVLMHSSMLGLAAHAKTNGLSMSQLGTLLHVHKLGACGVTNLSEDLGVTNAATSQMLDRLVQGGLVRREEDPVDRRSKRIELTAKGLEVMNSSMEARQQWFAVLAGTLNDDELATATRTLRLLSNRTPAITEVDQ